MAAKTSKALILALNDAKSAMARFGTTDHLAQAKYMQSLKCGNVVKAIMTKEHGLHIVMTDEHGATVEILGGVVQTTVTVTGESDE